MNKPTAPAWAPELHAGVCDEAEFHLDQVIFGCVSNCKSLVVTRSPVALEAVHTQRKTAPEPKSK